MTVSTELPVQNAAGSGPLSGPLSGPRSSPLSGWTARFAAASATPTQFAIREQPFLTQINLRGDSANAAFGAGIRGVLGCDLPMAANTWTGTADGQVIWLGPDEWLVVAADGRHESLVPALRAALGGMHHAITDVSANRTTIEISGDEARLVLAKGCTLDLHAESFGPHKAAQTLLAKSQVILQGMGAPSAFRLYVRNSFAHYLATWLTGAAAECAASRKLDADRITSRLG